MSELFGAYCAHGWFVTPIPRGSKGPVHEGWNLRENAETDPEVAPHYEGAGLLHAYSGTCCVDIDDLDQARGWLAQRGVDVDALMREPDAVMISSGRPNRAKLLYLAPTGALLPSFKLPAGFELRCGTRTGRSVQDALPPTIHPTTNKPYEWRYGDDTVGDWRTLPKLPRELEILWAGMIRPEEKPRPEPAPGRADVLRLRKILKGYKDPDCSYDDWVKAGMALHHETSGGDIGLQVWDEWSAGGQKYKGIADLRTHWESFGSAPTPVTIGSLLADQVATAEDFDEVTPEQVAAVPAVIVDQKPTLPHDAAERLNALSSDKTGKVLSVLPNLALVLGIPELTGTDVALDTFKDAVMVSPHNANEWREFRDTDYTAMRIFLETTANFYPVAKELMRDAVHYMAEQNKIDSAQTWLESLKWDGEKRVERFCSIYFGTVDRAYERAVAVYLWTALAGRVMSPGCQVDMAPILIGPQGVGKSQGIKALVPEPQFYAEIRLDDPDDVSARKMRGVLVGELAELRGLKTRDLESIKAFVTRTHEKWIPKYQEFATTFPRRLVMIGSSNEDELFEDEENRRWLPLRTAFVDVEAIVRDRDQLWAEALELWREHGVLWHEAQTHGKKAVEEFKVQDEWVPTVKNWIDEGTPEFFTLGDAMVQALGLDIRRVKQVDQKRVGRILRDLGFEKVDRRVDGRIVKMWRRRPAEVA